MKRNKRTLEQRIQRLESILGRLTVGRVRPAITSIDRRFTVQQPNTPESPHWSFLGQSREGNLVFESPKGLTRFTMSMTRFEWMSAFEDVQKYVVDQKQREFIVDLMNRALPESYKDSQ